MCVHRNKDMSLHKNGDMCVHVVHVHTQEWRHECACMFIFMHRIGDMSVHVCVCVHSGGHPWTQQKLQVRRTWALAAAPGVCPGSQAVQSGTDGNGDRELKPVRKRTKRESRAEKSQVMRTSEE